MKSNRKTRLRNVVSSTSLVFGLASGTLALPQTAHAQAAAIQRFEIAPGDLTTVLQRYSADTGIQLIYSSDLVTGKRSAGVSGTMSPSEGLSQLLAGTGLLARISGHSATIAAIADAVEPGSERVLGAVRVEGVQESADLGRAGKDAGINGINGSRDITATEGTGSYTSGALTVGSKLPLALKDTTKSVSVLTAETLKDRNLTEFTQAMKQLPGVTVLDDGYSTNTFYSRGFALNSIQIDGGSPLAIHVQQSGQTDLGFAGFIPIMDMAIYDHIELLRGSDGTFIGAGNPSGSINLVRKRPLDHSQVVIEAAIGSWSNYRVVADLTSPLTGDGKLRGRFISAFQDKDFFYDVAHDRRLTLSGTLEYELTPSTIVSIGANYSKQDSIPNPTGLPRYEDGTDIGLPRSTCFCLGFSYFKVENMDLLAKLEQQFGEDWSLKINLTRTGQRYDGQIMEPIGAVSTTTHEGQFFFPFVIPPSTIRQYLGDATLDGSFKLFGHDQLVTIGANFSRSESPKIDTIYVVGGPYYYNFAKPAPAYGRPTINIDTFDPNDFAKYPPGIGILKYIGSDKNSQNNYGFYANVRLTPFSGLHITSGARYNYYNFKDPVFLVDYGEGRFSPPSAALSYDVSKRLTGYFSYTDIYESNVMSRTKEGRPIKPTTGSTLEVGLKFAPRGGKLNASVAAYSTKRKNFPQFDTSVPFEVLPGGAFCCYVEDPETSMKSRGVDTEITGEIARNTQISASFNYNLNKFHIPSSPSLDSKPLVTLAPKYMAKLWVTHNLVFDDRRSLRLSAGFDYRSSTYVSGSVCTAYKPPVPPSTTPICKTHAPFDFVDPGAIVVNASVEYRWGNWNAALNLENLLDRTYYAQVGSAAGGNRYGAPRNIVLTIRRKW